MLKTEAATKWCLENGFDEYLIFTGDELRTMKII